MSSLVWGTFLAIKQQQQQQQLVKLLLGLQVLYSLLLPLWGCQTKEEKYSYEENKKKSPWDINSNPYDGDRDIWLWLHEILHTALVVINLVLWEKL